MRCHGVAFWHQIRQVLGIEACPAHKVWLIHKKLPERQYIKLQLLPSIYDESQTCHQLSREYLGFINEG